MLSVRDYCTIQADEVVFRREQASAYAKDIAGDYNPIHDIEAARFCVPGDLIFAVALERYGISQQMHFDFVDMLADQVAVILPSAPADKISLADSQGRCYLTMSRRGECVAHSASIQSLGMACAQLSGQTFPNILVKLMADQGVMINPKRPMVIYKSISFDFQHLDWETLDIEFDTTALHVDGRRGTVLLQFLLKDGPRILGRGEKCILLSGLREYDQGAMDQLVSEYAHRKHELSN